MSQTETAPQLCGVVHAGTDGTVHVCALEPHPDRRHRSAQGLWWETYEAQWPLVHPYDDGIRPAGLPDECFYCNSKVGTAHALDCVAVKKLVRVRYEFDIDKLFPYSWSAQDITEFMQSSTWCADNAIEDLKRHTRRTASCLCGPFKGTFLNEQDPRPVGEVKETAPSELDTDALPKVEGDKIASSLHALSDKCRRAIQAEEAKPEPNADTIDALRESVRLTRMFAELAAQSSPGAQLRAIIAQLSGGEDTGIPTPSGKPS